VLEQRLHQRFAGMRLYEGRSASELFRFDTRRKQKAFEQLLHEFSTCCIEPVIWNATGTESTDASLPLQGTLFPALSLEQQQLAADMARGGIPITTIARTLGCSRHTVYKALVQTSVGGRVG